MKRINILLIEDNPADARMLWETLSNSRRHGTTSLHFEVSRADRLSTGLQRLSDGGIDVVLLDLMLPDSQGLDTLSQVGQLAPNMPIVILTGFTDDAFVAQAVKAGAQDYLVKGQTNEYVLVHAIRYAIERQQMRLELQASEARFRNLIVNNADGVVVVDRAGVIRFVNPAAEALFGHSSAALVDTNLGFPLLVGETTELDIVDRHGEMLVVEMRLVETTWEGDGVYLASLRDITERKRAEETLRQREEQLRLAQKMEAIGRLAGGVAHDFNNLLTAILGYSDLMLMRLGKADKLRRYAEQISRAANRAASVTRQLLAFSRQQMLQPRVLGLNTVVIEMEKMLQPMIGEDIEVSMVLEPRLGHVRADLGHIQQLIMNLVINARDAMPRGGQLRIKTANVDLEHATKTGRHLGAPPGAYVMLEISDTGEGIAAEHLPHLFEPFFTTKEIGKGTGLGLAVAYGILQQNGGDIEVRSRAGRGTTFTIYLPQVLEALQAGQAATSLGASPAGLETVLLVEDEEIVRILIRDTLRLKGYRVLEATDTIEALQRFTQHTETIHLLVTDVIMPGMNGRELAERLMPFYPHMRVLFISGHPGDALARHGVVDTNTAFLQKPFTPDVLARKVRNVLDAAPPMPRGSSTESLFYHRDQTSGR